MTPAKIIPSKSPNPHMSCCGLSTSHDDPGTESCAFPYGTGAQPAGVADCAAGAASVAVSEAAFVAVRMRRVGAAGSSPCGGWSPVVP